MISNLSAFPSSLTVIPVPDGDLRRHREEFFVNENLKRLGCSGRVGIQLATPSAATDAKFHQLYRTSEKVPLAVSVVELVKLCQVALMLFGKLDPDYVDGLLCDMTEKAINDWWVEIGSEHYNVEPHDGILGPTSVAAILGMLMGARSRLHATGAPVAKDVFDVESTKRGIAYFQKQQRMTKTRRLDRQTLHRLHKATAKDASREGWTVPRAVKSTVAELSGKGGEMVMDMVGGRDKAGIADVETVDIERFVQLLHGSHAKWLWWGKARKGGSGDAYDILQRLPEEGDMRALKSEQGEIAKSLRGGREFDAEDFAKPGDVQSNYADDDAHDSIRHGHRKATSRMPDTRSGFGKLRDAVGRRGHQRGISREEPWLSTATPHEGTENTLGRIDSVPDRDDTPEHDVQEEEEDDIADDHENKKQAVLQPRHANAGPRITSQRLSHSPMTLEHKRETTPADLRRRLRLDEADDSKNASTASSLAGDVRNDTRLNTHLADTNRDEIGQLLRRSQSLPQPVETDDSDVQDHKYMRHLSFSITEESLLRWEGIGSVDLPQEGEIIDPEETLAKQILISNDMKSRREQLAYASDMLTSWVNQKITVVQGFEAGADHDAQQLDDMYFARQEEFHALEEDAKEIFAQEKTHLQEAIKDIEVLSAKLEYEINSMRSKVDDVEDGVAEFEKQVAYVEDRVKQLEDESHGGKGWFSWLTGR